MNCLITGATGNVGGRVVEQLLAEGVSPRLFVRDEAKARARFGERASIVCGDLGDEASLRRALGGCDVLLLVNSGPELAARDALAATLAREQGVQRIVKLSALGARARGADAPATAVALWHAQGEAALRASGVPYTFVQPVGFMSNALAWARSIKASGCVRASTGAGRIAMIDPDDIAAVCTRALLSDAYAGRALAITGPALLDYAEMVGTIAAAIGKPLRFEPITDAEARSELLSHGMPAPLAAALVLLWSEVREGLVAIVSDEVERVLGREPRSFARWVEANVAEFR